MILKQSHGRAGTNVQVARNRGNISGLSQDQSPKLKNGQRPTEGVGVRAAERPGAGPELVDRPAAAGENAVELAGDVEVAHAQRAAAHVDRAGARHAAQLLEAAVELQTP